MRSKLIVVAGVLASASALVHCSSSETPDAPSEDASVRPDVVVADAGDASPITDAAMEDEFEIPDGAIVCDATPCALAIGSGYTSASLGGFCALLDDGTVQCWGHGPVRRLGYDIDASSLLEQFSSAPRRVEGLSGATSIGVGGDNGCAVVSDGGTYCWGNAALVNAGVDPDASAPIVAPALATRQDLVPPASAVAVGMNTACVTDDAGAMRCWGHNGSGQLGRPPAASAPPAEVAIEQPVAIAAPADGRTFAITEGGEIFSWGADSTGRARDFLLGRDTSEDPDPVPHVFTGVSGVRAVSSGTNHSCAIIGRRVECWGGSTLGDLGRGATGVFPSPPAPTILEAVAPGEIPLHLSVDYARSCVVMGSGSVYCWQSRDSVDAGAGEPWRVEGLSGPAVAVTSVQRTTCALLRSGVVECWGANITGALGRGIEDHFFVDPNPGRVLFAD
ncbi:MAG: hypothetical protein BGO98_14775 [Myxococcales bacterium 68-20]|nr:hypothetical protein [Myxococcales bacterium]OJY31340.1 MAG: hypothetical protein BGO98_14775 [Myxococcales bacterium 68-20]